MRALRLTLAAAIAAIGLTAGHAWAVPALQIGAPAGPDDEGSYADYLSSTTNPTEDDTAITSGGTLYAAGVYRPKAILLGGKYSGGSFGDVDLPAGDNWTDMINGLADIFDQQGAILVVSVPDSTLATALASLRVNGLSAFYSSATESYLGDNHAPAKEEVSDFLFFNIGNFTNTAGVVPNFADEAEENANGEIKTLTITGFGSLEWAHFDVMALETDTQGQTSVKTSVATNPNSHDVTWKPEDGTPPQEEVPEPGLLSLLGLGLMGLWFARRRINR